MADSVTQPDTNDSGSSLAEQLEQDNHDLEMQTMALPEQQSEAEEQPSEAAMIIDSDTNRSLHPVIWTPRFIIVFALILTVGLSVNGVMSQDWANGGGLEFWYMVIPALIILSGWIVAFVKARSRWVRTGSIFGCIWAIFTALSWVPGYIHAYRTFEIQTSTNMLIACSLLGLSLCLSMNRTPLRRWDTWLFRLTIPVLILISIVPFAHDLAAAPSIGILANDTAFSAILLSLLIWWLRPSCWKSQPGPTLIFGLIPAILLFLELPAIATRMNTIFFLETIDLCMFLGILRLIQGEVRWRTYGISEAQKS